MLPQPPPTEPSPGRRVLLLAPSARPDLDDLQLLAARLYLDDLRQRGHPDPDVAVCDPDGDFPADLASRLALKRPVAPIAVAGLPPVDSSVCAPVTPLMTRAMLALEWVRGQAVTEVVAVDLSGAAAYLALAVRQGLLAQPPRLTLLITGGARNQDLAGYRFPDFPDLALYHLEAEALKRADRHAHPTVAPGPRPAAPADRLLVLLADSGLFELEWLDRLLPRLTETGRLREVLFLRPGGLRPAQRRKAAEIGSRIGLPVRFPASHGDRPAADVPHALAVIPTQQAEAAALLAHLAAAWELPCVAAPLPKSPSLAAESIDAALRAPPPPGEAAWTLAARPQPVAPAPAPVPEGPRVTVCLVTFNRPTLLRQAVASLEAQTFRDFDVILIDDGSTAPDAIALLDALEAPFAQRGWRILRKKNGYLGAARNSGAALTRAPYLLFMDDDNLAKPAMIERFVRAAETSGADVLTCFNDCFRTTETNPAGAELPRIDRRRLFLGGAPALAPLYNILGDANALVRRSTFEAVGGFHEDYGITHEDWRFFLTCILKGARLEILPEALFHYRVADVSMTTTTPIERNLFTSIFPLLAETHPSAGGYVALALAEKLRFGPFADTP